MINVGIVDHHLNNFHADKFITLLRGPLASEEVEIVAAWESHPSGDDWCAKHKVRRASDPQDAVRGADAVMVLAPDNIETHRSLAEAVLPAGKPAMIDKFLAPNSVEAKAILDLAKRHGAPVFSPSSLRYAVELESALKEIGSTTPTEAFARGMGAWEGYGVHTLAMVLRILGHGVRRVIDTGTPTSSTVALDYGGGKRATLEVRSASNEWHAFAWAFGARVADKYVAAEIKDFDGFYANLMRRTAAFFRSGKSDMPVEEALVTVGILDAAVKSKAAGGEWVSPA